MHAGCRRSKWRECNGTGSDGWEHDHSAGQVGHNSRAVLKQGFRAEKCPF